MVFANIISIRRSIFMSRVVQVLATGYIQLVRLAGGDGKVDKQINCKHSRSSEHSYCSHNKTAQHDN